MLLLYYFLKMKDVTKRILQCDYSNKPNPLHIPVRNQFIVNFNVTF